MVEDLQYLLDQTLRKLDLKARSPSPLLDFIFLWMGICDKRQFLRSLRTFSVRI